MARRSSKIIPIDSVIHNLRGDKIILDADLARIYGVSTKRLTSRSSAISVAFPRTSHFV